VILVNVYCKGVEMSYVQTKEHRELIRKREKLEPECYLPPVRHMIFLIDNYIAKKVELENLKMKQAQLEDRIHCAKEFIKMLQLGGKG